MKAIDVMKVFVNTVSALGTNRGLTVEYILLNDLNPKQLLKSSCGKVKEFRYSDGTFYVEVEGYKEDETGLARNELNLNEVIEIKDGDIRSMDHGISIGNGLLNIELWADRLPQEEKI